MKLMVELVYDFLHIEGSAVVTLDLAHPVSVIKETFVSVKVCYNRYSWGAGKQGSEYSSWFIRLECISRRFLTMSRLSESFISFMKL